MIMPRVTPDIDQVVNKLLEELYKSDPEFCNDIKRRITSKLVDAILETDLLDSVTESIIRKKESTIDDIQVKVEILEVDLHYLAEKISRIETNLGIDYGEDLKYYGQNLRDQIRSIHNDIDALRYLTFNKEDI